uniref:Putative auxilin-related protein 1 n=1 Tax=Davidia involucrata TaxID=16924 RepID=A0A5B7AKI9_DAVIN
MDEFGILVESIGFKTQGKSAPMADLKGKTNINGGVSRNFGINLGFDAKPSSVNRPRSVDNWNSVNGSFDSDLDGIFRSNNNQKTENYTGLEAYDDVFGGPTKNSKPSDSRGGGDAGSVFDLESIFKGSKNLGESSASYVYDEDIFAGMPGKSPVSVNYDDAFGSMASPPKQSAPIDDLFGNFGGLGLELNSSKRNSGDVEKNAPEFDDLIPGFGGSSPPKNRVNSETTQPQQSSGRSAKSTSNLAEDPFVVLESSSSPPYTSSGLFSDPLKQDTGKSSVLSSIDELEDFAMGRVRSNANERLDFGDLEVETSVGAMKEDTDRTEAKEREQRGAFESENDLESFFSVGAQPSSVPGPSTTVDPVFDTLFQNRGPEVAQTTSGTSSSTKNSSSVTNIVDDFSFIFGAVTSSEEFEEVEGESEERRRARLNHHLRTQTRMAKALAEKNQRDFHTQQEQEERHRIAETLDDDIKRWAAGKEGNLRALLSSLQYVLWPECGWQTVSLTDLITSVSVKKVYYKATLCVHPDKVQQKGANLQQKYIAEKVFDVLKEAFNKFNSEEL